MNPKPIAAVIATAILWGTCQAGVTAAELKKFKDVSPTYWAKQEIDFLVGRQVINGYEDGRFGISGTITRAEAAVMIMRSLGWGYISDLPDPGYPDLSSTHWAYRDIAAMHNAGFFAPKGKFEPNKKVTRAEMAEMLVQTFGLSSTSGVKFMDMKPGDAAYDSITILAANQITTGYSDGTFRPGQTVTRSEFAVFLARALEERFRPASTESVETLQVLYDVEIAGQTLQLSQPLRLTDRVLLPLELFERMGFIVLTKGTGQVTLTTPEGLQFELYAGQKEIWVGDTSIQVDNAIEVVKGSIYIEGAEILRTLKKALVTYPEQRLARIEVPRVTPAIIKAKAPEAIVAVLHEELPYWQWAKKDQDYLELIRRSGAEAKRSQLLKEMQQLTEAFFQYEKEKRVIRGLIYYSDHVTGKLDAVSRGIEARYLLLNKGASYLYPSAGDSGSTGIFGKGGYEFRYTVSDGAYEYLEGNKRELIQELEYNKMVNFQPFQGLTIHGIPFSISEPLGNGAYSTWAGLASGESDMLVVNSSVQTFMHELGHNWDYLFGDHSHYLEVRGESAYKPVNNDWENRVQENFAEDFAAAFLTGGKAGEFGTSFGMPSEEQNEAFRLWVRQQEQLKPVTPGYISLNGATLIPDVLLMQSRSLQLEGVAALTVYGTIIHQETGKRMEIEIPSKGVPFNQTIELEEPGTYEVSVGKYSTLLIVQ